MSQNVNVTTGVKCLDPGTMLKSVLPKYYIDSEITLSQSRVKDQ